MAAPALSSSTGHLPMGRWVCDLAEVEAAYVPSAVADPRRKIWDDWVSLTAALRSVVGEINACWLSGSFFSTKPVPGDIDCLYVIDTDLLTAVPPGPGLALLNVVAASKVKDVFGVDIDSFVLEWIPTPGHDRPVGAAAYFENRGYWDNLWVRVKDTDDRLDSIPRRGYLEVIVDGYR